MKLIDIRREEFERKVYPIAQEYLDVNIYNDEYRKSMLHWDMCKMLCTYITHKVEYDRYEDAGLHLYVHDETQQLTDYLNETIGLPVCVGRNQPEVSNKELDAFTKLFITKLFNLVDSLTYVENKATELVAPTRRGKCD